MTTRNASPYIRTFTGLKFTPLTPDPAQIRIEDIAHALARLNRYSAGYAPHITVAEHCVLVSRKVPKKDALWGLMHDACEAYLFDFPIPFVNPTQFEKCYREHEALLMSAICERFGLPAKCPSSIDNACKAQLEASKSPDPELEFLNRFLEVSA